MNRNPIEKTIVAVDTGGTFTDLVLWSDGRLSVVKVPSTPDDPSRAILVGLNRLSARGYLATGAVDEVLHGSTVATNAVLERRGARTAFVTNRGFEDLLAIGRQNRPDLYALRVRREEPLVQPDSCFGVAGRLSPEGRQIEPLTDADLDALSNALGERGPFEAIAVCLLHSYANSEDEQRVRQALSVLAGAEISLSSDVLPQFREVERASATVLNAYVQPKMRRYLGRLADSAGCELYVVQSDGGVVSAGEASDRPVHTLLSGPAGGVVGALQAGVSAGRPRVISFDMGGTSTDVSLIDGGPTFTRESQFAGMPLAVTTIDIHTVGAGGGSLAWVDPAGALKVGPQSAGADPGPACYGRGDLPTVTDAHVALGRLQPTAFLGGEMTLQPDRSRAALADLAAELRLGVDETAQGIIDVANAHMVRAIKVISLERGHDPRDFGLVAFGGAGALHACELAQELGMTSVLIPRAPGLLSAVGILSADLTRELTASVLETFLSSRPLTSAIVAEHTAPLLRRAERFLDRQGVAPEARQIEILLDMRYRGQSFELAVEARDDSSDLLEEFHSRHEWRYGYRLESRPVEWVSVRVRARGRRTRPELGPTLGSRGGERSTDRNPESHGGFGAPWPVHDRDALQLGARLVGPAVVVEYSATTWLPSGWSLTVLADGTLLLEPAEHSVEVLKEGSLQ